MRRADDTIRDAVEDQLTFDPDVKCGTRVKAAGSR